MKILIMTDMEGCAGVLSHDDWVLQNGKFYNKGVRLLTEEVNAAVRGFFSAGAKEILVIDGHGAGGIDPELLDERVSLQHGWSKDIYPLGLDKTFSAVAFVGQHAKAGTPYSHITHTGWFHRTDVKVNDISIGEYGYLAFCAMELGVPTIFASGEKALCEEAEGLTPGVVTVSVKQGLLPDGLDELDTDEYRKAKLSAIHISPKKARELICCNAEKALLKLQKNPKEFKYPEIKLPYTMIVKFRKNGETEAKEIIYEHKDSLISLFNLSTIA